MIANNGKEALNLLKKNKIDLVISDIRMPDINGLDLLVKIKKEFPETKVIIMTLTGPLMFRKKQTEEDPSFMWKSHLRYRT
jgi:DNA-binding NtrC family response regulator